MINSDFLQVTQAGLQVTSAGTSARVAIPVNSAGVVARYVRLQALANCYVQPGDVTVTATANSILLSPNEAVILCTQGMTHIASLQETVAAKFNITPIEG